MKLPRRIVLGLGAGASVLPLATRLFAAQGPKEPAALPGEAPLAGRLAYYALGLRYEDLDGGTIERVKVHVIDALGCAVGALNERAVRICREMALPVVGSSTIIGTRQ